MRRITLIVLVMLLLIVVVVTFRSDHSRAQVMILHDGTEIRLYAVTYGTNHVVGPPLGRLAAKLPQSLRDAAQRHLGRRGYFWQVSTTQPELRIWCVTDQPPPVYRPPPSLYALAADERGVCSGERVEGYVGSSPSSFGFKVFPRRSRILDVRFFERPPFLQQKERPPRPVESLRFKNPRFGKFQNWEPETLPATKTIDDVEVALESFGTGLGNSTTVNTVGKNLTTIDHSPPREDDAKMSAFKAKFRPLSGTNQSWTIAGAQLSDATGNVLSSTSLGSHTAGNLREFTMGPSLWPDEKAWKLRLEIKRERGFASEELMTFKDVPLPTVNGTNTFSMQKTMSKASITLNHIIRRQPVTGDSWSSSDLSEMRLLQTGLPAGLHCDLVSVRTDDGKEVKYPSSSFSDMERTYHLQDVPRESKTMDITFAIHRSRFVEFFVSPTLELE